MVINGSILVLYNQNQTIVWELWTTAAGGTACTDAAELSPAFQSPEPGAWGEERKQSLLEVGGALWIEAGLLWTLVVVDYVQRAVQSWDLHHSVHNI